MSKKIETIELCKACKANINGVTGSENLAIATTIHTIHIENDRVDISKDYKDIDELEHSNSTWFILCEKCSEKLRMVIEDILNGKIISSS